MQGSEATPEYVSDFLVDILNKMGIEYVSLNPGSSYRALHDSVVQYGNNKNPKIVLCLHEGVAMAVANGYARAKRKPMAVMLHDTVGLMHATKGIFESWLKKVPVLIIGGTGPLAVKERRPFVDWIHTSRMNANLIRDFVKWDDEPYDLTGAVEALLRGYKISTTLPMGPVYLCYDILLQEQKLDKGFKFPELERYAAPPPPQIESKTLGEIAECLTNAHNPVIIADWVGRYPSAFSHLIDLAELLSIPVIDKDSYLNFPNTSPLNVTGAEEQVLRDADVVLAIEVPYLEEALTVNQSGHDRPKRSIVGEDAMVIQIGMEDYLTRGWSADHQRLVPVDFSVAASSLVAIEALTSECRKIMVHKPSSVLKERRDRATAIHNGLRERWAEEAKKSWSLKPISSARLASLLWDTIKSEDWVLGHGSINGWVRRLWSLEDPDRYFPSVTGTGSGLGESIGVALAHGIDSGKLFLCIIGDGDMLYTPSTLWTAAHLKLPMLIVIFNNRSYYQDEGHQLFMAKDRNRDPSKVGVGIRINDPPTDFATLARSFGCNGIGPVEDPELVEGAIKKALELVKNEKKPCLVDVITQPR